MNELSLIAVTSFGLEAVVARELKTLGYPPTVTSDGCVEFEAEAVGICDANLWLRSAERILLKVAEFPARDFDQLFDQVETVDWPKLLPRNARFPVNAKVAKSQINSVPNTQKMVKKAIVKRMAKRYHQDFFREDGAEYRIDCTIHKDQVRLTLDTTGGGLHKRGYRQRMVAAPLRETTAAALVQLSYWRSGRKLLDPFCGSGTIPIEAALIGRDIAPGLERKFAAESWPLLPAQDWKQAREAARRRIKPNLPVRLHGTDNDPKSIEAARFHARLAGVEQDIKFEVKDFSELALQDDFTCLVTNPPYGERVGTEQEAEAIYRELGSRLKQVPSWSSYVITSHAEFEKLFGSRAARRRKLYNAKLACTYFQFPGPKPVLPEEN